MKESIKNSDDQNLPNPEWPITGLVARKNKFTEETVADKGYTHTVDGITRWAIKDKEYMTLTITTIGLDIVNNECWFNERYGMLDAPKFTTITSKDNPKQKRHEVSRYDKEFFISFSPEQVEELKPLFSDTVKFYTKNLSGMAYGPFDYESWLNAGMEVLELAGRTPRVLTETDKLILKGDIGTAKAAPSAEPLKVKHK